MFLPKHPCLLLLGLPDPREEHTKADEEMVASTGSSYHWGRRKWRSLGSMAAAATRRTKRKRRKMSLSRRWPPPNPRMHSSSCATASCCRIACLHSPPGSSSLRHRWPWTPRQRRSPHPLRHPLPPTRRRRRQRRRNTRRSTKRWHPWRSKRRWEKKTKTTTRRTWGAHRCDRWCYWGASRSQRRWWGCRGRARGFWSEYMLNLGLIQWKWKKGEPACWQRLVVAF